MIKSPAPFYATEDWTPTVLYTEISLRDLFAMAALAALIPMKRSGHADTAHMAYQFADALLTEREKGRR